MRDLQGTTPAPIQSKRASKSLSASISTLAAIAPALRPLGRLKGRATPLHAFKLATPRNRLSLISRHLDNRPFLELNTPFSTERKSSPSDDVDYKPLQDTTQFNTKPEHDKHPQRNMSSQPPHPALLIPGPIEFDDQVLQAMSHFRYVAKPSLQSAFLSGFAVVQAAC